MVHKLKAIIRNKL